MSLNFSGALAGLGHGLATLGTQGIEEQQRVRADARITAREQAMAALTHQYHDQEAADAPAEYKAMTGPVVDRAVAEANQVQIPLRQVEARVTRDNADHTSDRNFAHEMALLNTRERLQFQTWRQQHGIEQADRQSYDLWRQANGIGRDATAAPPSRRNGTTGNYEEYRGGQWVDTGTRYPTRPDPNADDDGDGVANEYDTTPQGDHPASTPAPTGRGGRPVIAAPRPAAQGNDTPPVAGARRGADNQWYVTRNGRNFLVQGN